MDQSTFGLEQADAGELRYVERLLERNGLPAGDVRASPARFYVASDGDARVGIGGLESYGTVGLLRSVVVERSARGEGYGTELCRGLEARARADGVGTLYLLTTTASGFFADLGYVEVNRADVPEPIRRTAEFEGLCPATATCMRRSL